MSEVDRGRQERREYLENSGSKKFNVEEYARSKGFNIYTDVPRGHSGAVGLVDENSIIVSPVLNQKNREIVIARALGKVDFYHSRGALVNSLMPVEDPRGLPNMSFNKEQNALKSHSHRYANGLLPAEEKDVPDITSMIPFFIIGIIFFPSFLIPIWLGIAAWYIFSQNGRELFGDWGSSWNDDKNKKQKSKKSEKSVYTAKDEKILNQAKEDAQRVRDHLKGNSSISKTESDNILQALKVAISSLKEEAKANTKTKASLKVLKDLIKADAEPSEKHKETIAKHEGNIAKRRESMRQTSIGIQELLLNLISLEENAQDTSTQEEPVKLLKALQGNVVNLEKGYIQNG